ncbi:MAG: helix-turn-helix domain-containing protein [Candidatus Eremiobacteraeota bacterium]|nr:helix-turn-helix domain-containing protein [Candidatus Eremiobacteraeota bacterium]
MDDLLLSKIRLAIVAELLASQWASFSELQKSVGTTNGNLSAHLGKLVEHAYVEEEKSFVDRRPHSRYRLTPLGRERMIAHVRSLQMLLEKEPQP